MIFGIKKIMNTKGQHLFLPHFEDETNSSK